MILPTVSAIIMDFRTEMQFIQTCANRVCFCTEMQFMQTCANRVCFCTEVQFMQTCATEVQFMQACVIGFVIVLKCSLCRLVLIRFVHGGVSRRYTRNRLYCVLPIYFRCGLFLHF